MKSPPAPHQTQFSSQTHRSSSGKRKSHPEPSQARSLRSSQPETRVGTRAPARPICRWTTSAESRRPSCVPAS